MKLHKAIKAFALPALLAVAAVALLPDGIIPSANAQGTPLTRTTLNGAIDNLQTLLTVTSATGMSASTSSAQTFILVNREQMQIRAITGSVLTVIRAVSGGPGVAHPSGSTVIYGTAGNWSATSGRSLGVFLPAQTTPSGACARSTNERLPLINGAQRAMYNCLGGFWAAQDMPSDPSTPNVRVCTTPLGAGALVSMGAATNPGTAGNFYYGTFTNPTTRIVNNIAPLWGVTVGSAAGFVGGIYEWNTVTSGALLFNTTTAGTASGTASVFEAIAVGTPGLLTGPATYMFFMNNAGTTDGIRTIAASAETLSTLRAGTFGTLPSSVAAATGYVASTAPVVCYN